MREVLFGSFQTYRRLDAQVIVEVGNAYAEMGSAPPEMASEPREMTDEQSDTGSAIECSDFAPAGTNT
jgi:hypothetical protein